MQVIKFERNRDIVNGIKLLAGTFPIGIVDGVTYIVSSKGEKVLNKNEVRFMQINGAKTDKLKKDFEEMVLHDS